MRGPENLTYRTLFVPIMQFVTSVNCVYSDSVEIQTMAQGEEKSPAQNRWRSISLFGMSANTWRDFYRSGAMIRGCEPSNRMSHNITGKKHERPVCVQALQGAHPLTTNTSPGTIHGLVFYIHLNPRLVTGPQQSSSNTYTILVPTYNQALRTAPSNQLNVFSSLHKLDWQNYVSPAVHNVLCSAWTPQLLKTLHSSEISETKTCWQNITSLNILGQLIVVRYSNHPYTCTKRVTRPYF